MKVIVAIMILRDDGGTLFCSNSMVRIGGEGMHAVEDTILHLRFACANLLQQHANPLVATERRNGKISRGFARRPPDCFIPAVLQGWGVQGYGLRTSTAPLWNATMSLMDGI